MEKSRFFLIIPIILFFHATHTMENRLEYGYMRMNFTESELSAVKDKMMPIIRYVNDNAQLPLDQTFFSIIKDTYETINKKDEFQAQIFIVSLDQNLQFELDERYSPKSLKRKILLWLYAKRNSKVKQKSLSS